MRVLIFLTAFLSCLHAAAADDATGAAESAACAACHNTMVNLKGRGAAAIAEQIGAIRAGEKAHPPGLAELSEEDIAIIAAYLDGAD